MLKPHRPRALKPLEPPVLLHLAARTDPRFMKSKAGSGGSSFLCCRVNGGGATAQHCGLKCYLNNNLNP